MSIPQISGECILSVLGQATRQKPESFACDTMLNLNAEQAEFSAGLHVVANKLTKATIDEQQIDSLVEQLLLTAFWCGAGLTYKAINAQIEAKELEEQWA